MIEQKQGSFYFVLGQQIRDFQMRMQLGLSHPRWSGVKAREEF